MKSFAGIGSRNTPQDQVDHIDKICERLVDRQYTLRTGGAAGADQMFYDAYLDLGGTVELFLPWSGYNGKQSTYCKPTPEAYKVAELFHPTWHILSRGAKKLMARNVHVICGSELDDPVDLVVCWTVDGADGTTIPTSRDTGGTGMGIRLAAALGIPVYNQNNRFDSWCLEEWNDTLL